MTEAGTLTRFALFVILRNQVADRAVVRRALAVEAAMEELAARRGADARVWALAGLGADIDAELCAQNPERRGAVAEELLLTEGAPREVAAAARLRHGPVSAMDELTAALTLASALVDDVHAELALGTKLDEVEPFALAHRLERAATRRGDEEAQRVLDAAAKAGIELEAAATLVVDGMRRIREDLRL